MILPPYVSSVGIDGTSADVGGILYQLRSEVVHWQSARVQTQEKRQCDEPGSSHETWARSGTLSGVKGDRHRNDAVAPRSSGTKLSAYKSAHTNVYHVTIFHVTSLLYIGCTSSSWFRRSTPQLTPFLRKKLVPSLPQ